MRRYCLLFLMLMAVLPRSTHSAVAPMGSWATAQELVQQMRRYPYPYEQSIDEIIRGGTVLIFSYGSLMDKNSAGRTLSQEALVSMRPALAFGVVRTFDRDISVHSVPRWETPVDPQARGMLNLRLCDPYYFVNGMLIEVNGQDLRELLKREEGYDLIPVVVGDWRRLQSGRKAYTVAYTFYAVQGSHWTSDDIVPRPGYYELVRNAAWSVGPLFGHLWYATTFQADGTPIADWERDVTAEKPHTHATSGGHNH